MKKYMKEIDGDLLIRTNDEGLLEKYDKNTKLWVRDYDLMQIYFGGIMVKEISKEEMDKLISK